MFAGNCCVLDLNTQPPQRKPKDYLPYWVTEASTCRWVEEDHVVARKTDPL